MKTNLLKGTGKYVVITTLSATTITVALVVTHYRHRTANSSTVTQHSAVFNDLAKVSTVTNTVKHKIKPPLKDVDVPYKSFHYKAEKGATLAYGNSHIH